MRNTCQIKLLLLDMYLAAAQPQPNRLLYVLSPPLSHEASIILARFVPPLLRDREQSATHNRHFVVEVFEPVKLQAPVEDHLLPDSPVILNFPSTAITSPAWE